MSTFPEGITFHTHIKNRNNTLNTNMKRDIGRQILNGLNFNNKWRETSKATHPVISWKRHWKKCHYSLRDGFIQWMYVTQWSAARLNVAAQFNLQYSASLVLL